MSDPRETDRLKRLAALAAVSFIQDGMIVGLGTGSTARHVILADHSKRVQVLGEPFPLSIEVMPFGWGNTASQIETLGGKAVARQQGASSSPQKEVTTSLIGVSTGSRTLGRLSGS